MLPRVGVSKEEGTTYGGMLAFREEGAESFQRFSQFLWMSRCVVEK